MMKKKRIKEILKQLEKGQGNNQKKRKLQDIKLREWKTISH